MSTPASGPRVPHATGAIERARAHDARDVDSARDAAAIARSAEDELRAARDPRATAQAIGAALSALPRHVNSPKAAHALHVVRARLPQTRAMTALFDEKGVDFDELSEAATALVRTAVKPKRRNSGRDIPWDGPARTTLVQAVSRPFAWQLSRQGLAHHRAHGRDALGVIVSTLLQLGIVQGHRLERGAAWSAVQHGVKARAQGSPTPSVEDLTRAFLAARAGKVGEALRPVAGAAQGVLSPDGPPFIEEELKAPVRAALRFAYLVEEGPALEEALSAVLALGVAQGRRLATTPRPQELILALALDALTLGDDAQLRAMVALLE